MMVGCSQQSPDPAMNFRDEWVAGHMTNPVKTTPAGREAVDRTSSLPFSFVYDGRPSDELLAAWPKKTRKQKLDACRTQRTWTWTDPATGLEVKCVAVEYSDFPVVEWTIYFRNGGKENTPILENIQGLDTTVQRTADGEFVLHSIRGDSCTPDSYAPYHLPLRPNANQRFAPVGGRATNGAFPYYNLQMPDGGVIIAVGWPGQWASCFVRDANRSLRIIAGQELTRMYLKPGEEIRSPLTAMLFWRGDDTVAAQNIWRRWMLEHNMPRPDGKTLKPMYAFCSGGFFPGLKVSEAGERQFIDTLSREKIKLDYWWMDAGWYACNNWPEVGTWEYDTERFPNGIRAISDYLHKKGTKLILWFEPERVTGGSWIAKNHPEWLLGGTLLNLGNTEARAWLTNHISEFIKSQGIDLYRQDFNMDPLGLWRNNDASDRQGITENLHVQGYLAYWDALLKRNPGLRIDSCASGGRRNDLETMRRAVPLLRSDYQAFDGNPAFAPGNQGHTYGLSSWIPFYGQGVYHTAQNFVYCVRSHMCPSFVIAVDVRKPGIDWDQYRMLVDQWRQTADCMLGDFYPLTPYSLAEENWIAWQFDRPEDGDGMVQAFRRTKSEDTAMSLQLRGLQPDATYEVINFDDKSPRKASGRELTEQGLKIEIGDKPGSALIKYRHVKD